MPWLAVQSVAERLAKELWAAVPWAMPWAAMPWLAVRWAVWGAGLVVGAARRWSSYWKRLDGAHGLVRVVFVVPWAVPWDAMPWLAVQSVAERLAKEL